MKSFLFATAVLCLSATTASAQTTTLIHGQKVLTKDGVVVVNPGPQLPPPAPLVGGSDSCATPDLIVGTGFFPFNNTTATTGVEGQNEAACLFFTLTGITTDVWFTWNAPFTGLAQVELCTLTAMDSKVAIYDGTACPTAAAIACNDDSCASYQSRLTFPTTLGNSYVIQLGCYPGASTQVAQFKISNGIPPVVPPNDDCSLPITITGPSTLAFDTTLATTGAEGQNEVLCQFAVGGTAIANDIWYTFIPTVSGTASVSTCAGTNGSTSNDSKIAIYDGAGCPAAPAIACNDDATCVGGSALNSIVTFSVICGQSYTIQLGRYATAGAVYGTFKVEQTGTVCGPNASGYCFGDGSGTACPCGNAGAPGNGCASSVNASGANLAASGTTVLSNDTLVITGTGMPNSTCLYFQGTTQLAGTVFGDGLRCAGGSVIRLGTKANAAGTSSYPVGADLKISVKGLVTAPGARTYQAWYRNAAAFCTASTFNLSNGLLVNWN
jgi:hypothetical protein